MFETTTVMTTYYYSNYLENIRAKKEKVFEISNNDYDVKNTAIQK